MEVFLFMRRVADNANISVIRDELNVLEGTDAAGASSDDRLNIVKGVEVYEIDGPFFFGMANKFDEEMRIIGDKPVVRIIRMRKVPFIDSTGLHNLQMLVEKLEKEHIRVILSGVRQNVLQNIKKSGLSVQIGEENIFDNIGAAVTKANQVATEVLNSNV